MLKNYLQEQLNSCNLAIEKHRKKVQKLKEKNKWNELHVDYISRVDIHWIKRAKKTIIDFSKKPKEKLTKEDIQQYLGALYSFETTRIEYQDTRHVWLKNILKIKQKLV